MPGQVKTAWSAPDATLDRQGRQEDQLSITFRYMTEAQMLGDEGDYPSFEMSPLLLDARSSTRLGDDDPGTEDDDPKTEKQQ